VLATIAFSLAATVRGEIERTSTALDGARAYFLATGALERALLYMQWGQQYRLPDGSSRYYTPWSRQLRFAFPSGEAVVEVAPETAKVDLNSASREDLLRLLAALGAAPEQAQVVTAAILDWRSMPPEGRLTEFDRYSLSLVPSFRPRHASFQEVEELLLVRGMTPELYHGTLERDRQGRLAARTGLKDCVTVYGGGSQVDVNAAPPEVLAAAGIGPAGVAAILETRRMNPFRSPQQLRALGFPEQALRRLVIGGGPVYTLRATARLRLADGKLSDLSRSAGVTVSMNSPGYEPAFLVLRWHGRTWVQDDPWKLDNSLQ
jgi:general secretion pathway protein K